MKRCSVFISLALLMAWLSVSPALAAKASAFEAEPLSSGPAQKTLRFDPGALKQPVLLVFWASWCTSCQHEATGLMELHQKWGGKLDFLGVSVDQKKEKGQSFLTEYKISYPNVLDPDLKIAEKYGVSGTPTLILLDRKGEIRFEGHHVNPEFQKSLAQVLGESS